MLSIIIPTFEEEEYLPFLLQSIQKQTLKDYEVIVADAFSKDNTLEIAERFHCKITKGGLPAKSRNEGAKIAQGDILLFIDADDRLSSDDFLEKACLEFQNRNLAAASFPIYPKGIWLDKIFYGFYNLWVKISQGFLPHATGLIMVNKEVHYKISGFDEEVKLGEDHDYVRRAAQCGKFAFVETSPVITSSRRFEKNGRIRVYFKYILAGLFILFCGPIKTDFFKYNFEKNNNKKSKKI